MLRFGCWRFFHGYKYNIFSCLDGEPVPEMFKSTPISKCISRGTIIYINFCCIFCYKLNFLTISIIELVQNGLILMESDGHETEHPDLARDLVSQKESEKALDYSTL